MIWPTEQALARHVDIGCLEVAGKECACGRLLSRSALPALVPMQGSQLPESLAASALQDLEADSSVAATALQWSPVPSAQISSASPPSPNAPRLLTLIVSPDPQADVIVVICPEALSEVGCNLLLL